MRAVAMSSDGTQQTVCGGGMLQSSNNSGANWTSDTSIPDLTTLVLPLPSLLSYTS